MTVVDEICAQLGPLPTRLFGVGTGPEAAFVAAALARDHRPVVLVVPSEDDSSRLASDVQAFLNPTGGASDVLHVPELTTSPYAAVASDRNTTSQRISALYRLAAAGSQLPRVIVVSITSLAQRAMPKRSMLLRSRVLSKGDPIGRDELLSLLANAGYTRTSLVLDPGSMAIRGDVVDIFPPAQSHPCRLEFLGDDIESLRLFDTQSQKSLREVESLAVHPCRDTAITDLEGTRDRILAAADEAEQPSTETRKLLSAIADGDEFLGIQSLLPAIHGALVPLTEYLPEESSWLVVEPAQGARNLNVANELAHERWTERRDQHKLAFPPAEYMLTSAEVESQYLSRPKAVIAETLEVSNEQGLATGRRWRIHHDRIAVLASQLKSSRGRASPEPYRPLASAIGSWLEIGYQIAIICEARAHRGEIESILARYGYGAGTGTGGNHGLGDAQGRPPENHAKFHHSIEYREGRLSESLVLPGEQWAFIAAADVLGRLPRNAAAQRRVARRARAALRGQDLDFSQLLLGDPVVHQLHGIGRYLGLTKLPLGTAAGDFLHIEYRGGTLYLPVYRIGEVQRYVGPENRVPQLDKLGGHSYATARKKASRDVRQLAESLLQLYAQRRTRQGHAFPAGDEVFAQFEASFPFEETPDQERAIAEVLADMESEQPMDRLVCGDVGFGKTEVAMRALFKAVLGGKQVALLAPTTVLVEQHFATLTDRFSQWPVKIARLSRFRNKSEQLAAIQGLASGSLDVVIGTHRLLSNDIRFKDLGLLIVDEEQRFGVTHKEKLKQFRSNIDVLTLSATPIPRTLNMSLAGLRDLSIIATPPAHRLAIHTLIARNEDSILREGLRRELARQGQVFFVCPRIDCNGGSRHRTMEDWATTLQALCPDAKVAVAHGRMQPAELESVMIDFVERRIDVLIATTIVESGIDIPRANTMFIDRADQFGLAQLYQLRGRIGRSQHQAYCYLLVPEEDQMTSNAAKRLQSMQRFTDLGAGFSVASQDLEIRGAGELLGNKQSGAIAAIGFEAYSQMLDDAIADLRGEPTPRHPNPDMNVTLPAFIPDDYAPDAGQRLVLYRRLAHCASVDDVAELLDEIRDRYGPPPEEVVLLGDVTILRILAAKLSILALEVTPNRLVLTVAEATPPKLVAESIAAGVAKLTAEGRISFPWPQGTESAVARSIAVLEAMLRDLSIP